MYSLESPDRDSLLEPSGFIVISLLLLVLNLEYSSVDKSPEAFIINAIVELKANVEKQ